jgi:hypothetical protein
MVSVRLLVTRSAGGRFEGSLSTEDGSVEHGFSGTLELLRLLEDLADVDAASQVATTTLSERSGRGDEVERRPAR